MREEERRQAERGEVANSGNSHGAIFGSGRVLPRETTKAVEELGERGDKGGGGGGGDGLTTERQPGWSSNSREIVRGKQRTPSRSKAKQEGTEEALEATGVWETFSLLYLMYARSNYLRGLGSYLKKNIKLVQGYMKAEKHMICTKANFSIQKKKGGTKVLC